MTDERDDLIERIEVLSPADGDVLVIRLRGVIDSALAEQLRARVREFFAPRGLDVGAIIVDDMTASVELRKRTL